MNVFRNPSTLANGQSNQQNANYPVEIETHEIDAFAANHLSTRYVKWERLFQQDLAAPISLHPEHVFCELARQPAATARPAWLVEAVRGSQVVGLAVLAPKTLNSKQTTGIAPNFELNGLRLVGGTCVGNLGHLLAEQLLLKIFSEVLNQSADFLLIEDLEVNSPMWNWLESAPENGFYPLFPNGIQPRHRIRFEENPEVYWDKFSAVSRKTHRRSIKKVQPAEMVRVTNPAQIDQFLTDVAYISERSWQSKHLGTRISYNSGLRRMFHFLAEARALRSYLLYHDGQPVAFEIATQHNGCFSGEESGYDMAFGNRSPGHALFLMMLQDMMAHDTPVVYDFGSGDAEYKQHYSTETSRSGSLLLFPPRFRPKLLAKYINGARTITRTGRYLLEKLGLREILRRQVRRGKI